MLIGIDKNTIDKIDTEKYECIYLFDNEPLEDLLKTKLHCIHFRRCNYVDINLTDYDIGCIKKAKVTDKDFDKLPERIEFKLGIIVPNFNYEHTLRKCFESIINQTYRNFEVIFVDDMSTDNSVKIAREYHSKVFPEINIKIIELKQKRYNGGARNEAYLHLSEDVDYIYYVDSDDWLEDNNVFQKIITKLQKKPDVLFVGMNSFKDGKEKLAFMPDYKDKYEAMIGWSGSCGKVIKKELATRQECLYNEGTLKEDKNQHCRICIYMNSFDLLKEPVYVWNRENYKSITTIRDEVLWGTSTIRHFADTKQLYLSEKGKDRRIDAILEKRVKQCLEEIKSGGDKQW